MSYEPSVLERLQLDVAARLASDANFAKVQVIVIRPRDANSATLIQTKIDQALAGILTTNGGSGAAVMVNMPIGDVPNNEAPGPIVWSLLTVRILENPLINMGAAGTQISAEDLMLSALNLLHRFYLQDAGSSLIADKNAFEPRPEFIEKGQVVYDVRFRMKMDLQGPAKVQCPLLTGDSVDGINFTSPTPDATIWYTTDGSYPTPANGTEVPYSQSSNVLLDSSDQPIKDSTGAPLLASTSTFHFDPGTRLRAVGYLNNYQASDLAALVVN